MTSYGASTKRDRWTDDEDAEVRDAIYDVLADDHPASVRGVYYRVLSLGMFAKSENNYRKIQRRVLDMRRSGDLPYAWITDGTRMRRKPTTYDGLDDALYNTARTYRRALWSEMPVQVEVWSEKDAIAGVLYEVTATWDVPLMVSRGYSSETFLWSAGQEIAETAKPTYIYYFSDYDRSGIGLAEQVAERLPEFADGVPIYFERAAVTPDQIADLGLITREPSKRDRREGWTECCEVDAIPSRVLRQIAADCITRHVDPDRLEYLQTIEEQERTVLEQMTEDVA